MPQCALCFWVPIVPCRFYRLLQRYRGWLGGRCRPRHLQHRSFPCATRPASRMTGLRSEEHTSELQSRGHLVCRLLLEKKKKKKYHLQISQDTTKITI